MEKLFAPISILEKAVNKQDRTIKGIITTNEVDRTGDIIRTKGINLKNYKNNPVVLFNHSYFDVLGKSERIKYFKDTKIEGLESTTKFASTFFASEMFELYAEGTLNAFSVGVKVKNREARTKKEQYLGDHITDCELLEYSGVSVPANASAVQVKALIGLKDQVSDETYKKLNPIEGFENFILEYDEMKRLVDEFSNGYKDLADELAEIKSKINTPEQMIKTIQEKGVDALTQVHEAENEMLLSIKKLEEYKHGISRTN